MGTQACLVQSPPSRKQGGPNVCAWRWAGPEDPEKPLSAHPCSAEPGLTSGGAGVKLGRGHSLLPRLLCGASALLCKSCLPPPWRPL